MAEKKRQCGTCRFFNDPEERGHGKCGHPLRAGASSDLLMYRATELGCRTKWGTSYWQDKSDSSDPTAPTAPQQPTLPEPPAIHATYDDEVTSVSIAGRSASRLSDQDDVINVDSTGYYAPDLQDKRRELLSRSNHDAVAAARKRSSERFAQKRELVPFADEDATEPESEPAPTQEPPKNPAASDEPGFPPEDYVEEERSAHDNEDGVVDDGIAPGTRRSPRVRNLMRGDNRPKGHKAMTFSPASGMHVESHNPDNRGQWNSVPTISDDFELPFKIARETNRPVKVAASAASAQVAQPARPVSQARDVLSEERKRAELRRRVLVRPLDETPQSRQPETHQVNRRLPRENMFKAEAPAQRTEHIEPREDMFQAEAPVERADVAQPAEDAFYPDAPVQRPERVEPPEELFQADAPVQRAQSVQHHPEPANRVQEARYSPLRGSVQKPAFKAAGTVRPYVEEEEDDRTDLTSARPSQRKQRAMAPRVAAPREDHGPYEETVAEAPGLVARAEPRQNLDSQYPLLNVRIAIAPDVPKVCGTCASFRPGNQAGCGGCVNRDANPEQGIVEDHELACKTTIGSWWIPADEEIWLDEFTLPESDTPRMDLLLEQLAKRRRAGRQETPTVLPDLEELA